MTVLAVDLAAKYSAACLMDEDFTVIRQFDSWQTSEVNFIQEVVEPWYAGPTFADCPEFLVIEDLPHGLKYSTLIKSVCRLQGRIAQAMSDTYHGEVDDVLFIAPAEWRRVYPGLERGTGPDAVVPVAAELGYEPPMDELLKRAEGVKGGKAIARKVATDYCSAYLIARWAITTKIKFGTYDVVGTSRYDTAVIRKKDFDDQDS